MKRLTCPYIQLRKYQSTDLIDLNKHRLIYNPWYKFFLIKRANYFGQSIYQNHRSYFLPQV